MHHTPTRLTLAIVAVASLTAACGGGADHATIEANADPVTASTETPETTAPTATSTVDPTTTVAAGTQNTTATTIKKKPAATTTSTTQPKPKPAEVATEAAPISQPVIITLNGPTSMPCSALMLAGGKVSISWTSGHTTSVNLAVNSSRGIAGLAPNGSRLVTVQCGRTNVITVTPINGGGAGDSKQFQVTIGA